MQKEIEGWDQVENLCAIEDWITLSSYIASLSSQESSLIFSRLKPETQRSVLTHLDPENAAQLMELLDESVAVDALEELTPKEAASILYEVESDEQADLITELDPEDAEAILAEMPKDDADSLRKLSAYPFDCAGGLMRSEFLAYSDQTTVGGIVSDFLANREAYSGYHVQYIYVTDELGKLAGVLRIRDLLLSPHEESISKIMIENPVSIGAETTLKDLAVFFAAHRLFALPVTSQDGKLVGVLRRADVEEALGDEAQEAFLKSQGIIGGEEIRSMPTLTRSGRRLSWLSVNILLNIASASVIAFYQDVLAAAIALAVFLPIISDMSGCSGNQAVAVSIRELTLGLVRPFEIWRVLIKEMAVGLINGLVLGILISTVAFLWKGDLMLGLVVGTALGVNTVVAVLIGGTIPLILKRFEFDPALASGPILTTLTDMLGFFMALTLAANFLL